MVSKEGLYHYCLLVLVIFSATHSFYFPTAPHGFYDDIRVRYNVTLYATPNISCQIRSYVILRHFLTITRSRLV